MLTVTVYTPPTPPPPPAPPLLLAADTAAEVAALIRATIGARPDSVARSTTGVVLHVPGVGHVHARVEGPPASAAAAAADLFVALRRAGTNARAFTRLA